MIRSFQSMSFFLLLTSTLFLCSQCKEDSPIQREIDLKHDEIMVIHDEVMPKMKEIYKLKKVLKKKKGDPRATEHIKSLEAADDAMMDWMHGYKKPKASSEGYAEYLAHQLILVNQMKTVMIDAIQNARTFTEQ